MKVLQYAFAPLSDDFRLTIGVYYNLCMTVHGLRLTINGWVTYWELVRTNGFHSGEKTNHSDSEWNFCCILIKKYTDNMFKPGTHDAIVDRLMSNLEMNFIFSSVKR